MSRIRLAIIIGGKTGEHKVNLISSKYVLPAIDRQKYQVVLIGINRRGVWYLLDEKDYLVNAEDPRKIEFKTDGPVVFPINKRLTSLIETKSGKTVATADVFFSLIGGTYAEDGRLQGLLDMVGAAYVGAGVTGSVLGIDKVVMKQVLRQSGVLVTDFIAVKKWQQDLPLIRQAEKELAYPIFVKPACLGSSVGVTKAYNRRQLLRGIQQAFEYDNKVILEKFVKGREIECAVLGNDQIFVSLPGEIRSHHDFYDYESKYIDPQSVELLIPAPLNSTQIKQAQTLAGRVYEALGCCGFGRVDMFFGQNGRWYANEINTIPGFTNMSMYPKLMELSGIKYSELIDRLVELAFTKKRATDRLRTEFIL